MNYSCDCSDVLATLQSSEDDVLVAEENSFSLVGSSLSVGSELTLFYTAVHIWCFCAAPQMWWN